MMDLPSNNIYSGILLQMCFLGKVKYFRQVGVENKVDMRIVHRFST